MARDRFEIPPERLGRWLERWTHEHGEITAAEITPAGARFTAADGAHLEAGVPFPPLARATLDHLVEHASRDRCVGVLLVRLGGHAAGVFDGARLVESKVGTRNVHGRHRAGGSSQRRFERRREGQARVALQAAADVAARILVPHAAALDAVVLGGDRSAVQSVLEDSRLGALRALAVERILDVPDPRLAVLRSTPELFRATILRAA